jgi:L-2-hydroxycarboxylate dehydrogenase (NAD+)
MTEAEVQGSDGHGAIRLVPYARRIRAGGYNLKPDIRVVKEKPAWRCSTATTAWATW